MTRKDEKDTERPHYYSQFWLDVAAGRREIGSSKAEEAPEADESLEPIAPARKSGRVTAAALADGHRNTRPRDIDEEDFATGDTFETDEAEDFSEPELEEDELAGDLDEQGIPDIPIGFPAEEEEDIAEIPPEEAEYLDDEEYYDEEDEDEDDWSSRGRKKPKPGRQTKAPKPSGKKPKRGGRGY
jgi:hypothetical protein